jgi:chromosome segregation ATPase
MEIEQRVKVLEGLVKKLQEQISSHESEIKTHNEELRTINDTMDFPSQNEYPSLYDLKQKAFEKGWFKKP